MKRKKLWGVFLKTEYVEKFGGQDEALTLAVRSGGVGMGVGKQV
jgi:hypothetical protein